MSPTPSTEPAHDAAADQKRLRRAFMLALEFSAILWLIRLAEASFGWDFSDWGIYPRHWSGLRGILLAPLIHASVGHLAANTGPVVVLGTALLYGYPKAARTVIPVLYLGSGVGVWLFAREAYHIGASGLCFGLLTFIFTMGVLHWERRAIALSLLVFFLYGGMLWGILPTAPGISFEYHLSGAVIGIVLALLLRHRDPPPPEKRYSWEDEADDGADDWIGEDEKKVSSSELRCRATDANIPQTSRGACEEEARRRQPRAGLIQMVNKVDVMTPTGRHRRWS